MALEHHGHRALTHPTTLRLRQYLNRVLVRGIAIGEEHGWPAVLGWNLGPPTYSETKLSRST